MIASQFSKKWKNILLIINYIRERLKSFFAPNRKEGKKLNDHKTYFLPLGAIINQFEP